jgi:Ulp1 family protease
MTWQEALKKNMEDDITDTKFKINVQLMNVSDSSVQADIQKVKNAAPDAVLHEFQGINIRQIELACCGTTKWYNSTLIEMVAVLLSSEKKGVCVLNTYFYFLLLVRDNRYCFANVKRWIRKLKERCVEVLGKLCV